MQYFTNAASTAVLSVHCFILFEEEDVANYDGTSYSAMKGFTDRLLRHFDNTLQCRIRLPVNYEADSRNLVAKVSRTHSNTREQGSSADYDIFR